VLLVPLLLSVAFGVVDDGDGVFPASWGLSLLLLVWMRGFENAPDRLPFSSFFVILHAETNGNRRASFATSDMYVAASMVEILSNETPLI
jgi:hypothetical protein